METSNHRKLTPTRNFATLHHTQGVIEEIWTLDAPKTRPEFLVSKTVAYNSGDIAFAPYGPLAIPRESIEEIAINVYVIPNKTIVLMNLYAMGRDPEYWRDPEKFIPNRFNNYVDNDVDDVKMIKGSSNVPMEFLGFGFGKRVCPGMLFATASSELTLARLLYHFDWKLPNAMNPEHLDMTEGFGAAATRKNNLYLVATPYD
ncbi:hypothetical protein KY290_033227 [Solanum tuberosum]|uniref:Cytochrome P450 n=1 Tax=Solanum tuberosum TaxID=4113 RepID=A0ABQ7TZN9_SOLTU|nr:hypothetical protein KY290_033227 [Solanum tuberosum]